MAAGTKYNLTPEYKPEEFYRVERVSERVDHGSWI